MKKKLPILFLSLFLSSYVSSQNFPLTVIDNRSGVPLYVLTTPIDTFGCDSIDHMRGVFRSAKREQECSEVTNIMEGAIDEYETSLAQKDSALKKDKEIIASKDQEIMNRDIIVRKKQGVIEDAIVAVDKKNKQVRRARGAAVTGSVFAILELLVIIALIL